MHADNSAHLIASAQTRHNNTRRRALDTLARLNESRIPITVSGLARTAGVARSWIYTQPDILALVRASSNPTTERPCAVDEPSWKRRHELAHQRIKELQDENQSLRGQLARLRPFAPSLKPEMGSEPASAAAIGSHAQRASVRRLSV